MTVDFCYSLVKFIASKNQGGYINPSDFNLVINQAQLSYLDYLLGESEQFQPGRAQYRVQYGMNESVRNILTRFISAPVPLTIDGNGNANYPADFQQVDAMFTSSMDRVRFVAQDALYSYLNSTIDPVASNPIYLLIETGFQFYPLTLGSALMSYVKTPADIKWSFVPDPVTGKPVYDPGTSVDPDWYDADVLNIIARALKMVGVNLQAPAISQYADQIKSQGQ